MKRRWLFIIAVLCTLLIFASCTAQNKEEETTPTEVPTTLQTAAPTEPATEAATQPTEETEGETTVPTEAAPSSLMVMTLNPAQENETAEDGTVVYSFRYQNIDLLMPGNPTAQEKIRESMNALIAYTKEQTNAARAWAWENYDGAEDWSAYFTDLLYTPSRLDETVVSVYAQMQDFSGGSHPNGTIVSMTFDANTGNSLTISDIIQDNTKMEVLASMVLEYLKGENAPNQLMEDYEEVVMERFVLSNASSANWYLSEQGLVYYFSPYEIAPYRYGVVEVILPYGELHGILRDEYLPESIAETEYSIKADIAANMNMEFERSHTIVLDPEGERITLYGLESTGSVKISVGYWGIDDNLFYPAETLFSAKNLTEQDCVQIVTYIPDTIPNVQISLGGENGKVLYLSQSGEDGSILLLEEGSF